MKRSICLALAVTFVFSLLLCGCKRGLEEDESTTAATTGTTDVTGTENETIAPGTTNGPTGNQNTTTGQGQTTFYQNQMENGNQAKNQVTEPATTAQ